MNRVTLFVFFAIFCISCDAFSGLRRRLACRKCQRGCWLLHRTCSRICKSLEGVCGRKVVVVVEKDKDYIPEKGYEPYVPQKDKEYIPEKGYEPYVPQKDKEYVPEKEYVPMFKPEKDKEYVPDKGYLPEKDGKGKDEDDYIKEKDEDDINVSYFARSKDGTRGSSR